MEKKTYWKGLSENLCGKDGFQYAIGGEFTAETDDDWHWLHFTKSINEATGYGPRIVEGEPVTKIKRYPGLTEMRAKTIGILRELSHDEIMERLIKEKVYFRRMIIPPTYEDLLRHKEHIRPRDYRYICDGFHWLTLDQKKALLPESWHKRIKAGRTIF